MEVKVDADERRQVHVHYADAPVPFVFGENYGGHYHIDDDEVALQEIIYHSLQRNSSTEEPRTPSAANSGTNQDQTQGREQQNESETISVHSQLLIDEALAKSLQELENEFSSTSITEPTVTGPDSSSDGSSATSGESSSTGPASPAAQDDNVDPDNMTYEELQTLGEAVGTESKGLSDEVISYLPTSTFKNGLFSKKNKYDECVICLSAYEHRDKLMKLPCEHQYHSICITKWLKGNKACPICKEEVFS